MSTSREGLLKIILENPNEQLTSGCGRRECFYLILMAPLKAIALMSLSLAPTYPLIFLEQNTKSAVADQSCSQTVATTPKIHKTTFDKSRKHIQLIDETALRKTFDNFIPLSSSWRILKCPMKETLPSHRFKNLTIPPIYCLSTFNRKFNSLLLHNIYHMRRRMLWLDLLWCGGPAASSICHNTYCSPNVQARQRCQWHNGCKRTMLCNIMSTNAIHCVRHNGWEVTMAFNVASVDMDRPHTVGWNSA